MIAAPIIQYVDAGGSPWPIFAGLVAFAVAYVLISDWL
jgi:hypothetical protein